MSRQLHRLISAFILLIQTLHVRTIKSFFSFHFTLQTARLYPGEYMCTNTKAMLNISNQNTQKNSLQYLVECVERRTGDKYIHTKWKGRKGTCNLTKYNPNSNVNLNPSLQLFKLLTMLKVSIILLTKGYPGQRQSKNQDDF